MGLFSSSAAPAEPPKATPPMRSQRAKCWDARDGFFKCLDAHDIVDSIKDADKAKASCGTQQASFEKECVASWVPTPPNCLPPPKLCLGLTMDNQVEYFKKRRVMEHKREKMLAGLQKEGASKMD
jgi:cytochrome c oxidase assembly factor 6